MAKIWEWGTIIYGPIQIEVGTPDLQVDTIFCHASNFKVTTHPTATINFAMDSDDNVNRRLAVVF
jgi:hypothetical protein